MQSGYQNEVLPCYAKHCFRESWSGDGCPGSLKPAKERLDVWSPHSWRDGSYFQSRTGRLCAWAFRFTLLSGGFRGYIRFERAAARITPRQRRRFRLNERNPCRRCPPQGSLMQLRLNLTDERAPIGQHGARQMGNVLGREPNRVAVR